MHVQKLQAPHFLGKKVLRGATQHRTGLVNNVNDVICIIGVIYVYVSLRKLDSDFSEIGSRDLPMNMRAFGII